LSHYFYSIFNGSKLVAVSRRDNRATKAMADKIPRDAAGNPIFLILLDGIRASYDRKLAACEAGWRETGDPFAVSEAAILVHLHRQPLPRWLTEAVTMLAIDRRGKAHAKRALEAAADSLRYQAVRDAKAERRAGNLQGRKVSWELAYGRAADPRKRIRGRDEALVPEGEARPPGGAGRPLLHSKNLEHNKTGVGREPRRLPWDSARALQAILG
jgi:hypothetical protein